MITLHKIAHLYPHSEHDLTVGKLGIFRESDFYCKSRQTDKLPESHEFDERVIEAYEYLYQIFSLKFGDQAIPKFSSTLRLEGDPNYRTAAGWLSYHSRARAADSNWNQHSQDIEDFIVCVVGYDVEQQGVIYQKLREIGIGGIGTYYREKEGTFIHLDTREGFVHFRKIKRYKMFKAKRWHGEMMGVMESSAQPNTLVEPVADLTSQIEEGIYLTIGMMEDWVKRPTLEDEDTLHLDTITSWGVLILLVVMAVFLLYLVFTNTATPNTK